MSESRLFDYLDHIWQAATDACSFIDGMSKADFLSDKRTQSAVVMSLVVIGEAATKVMVATLILPGSIRKFLGAAYAECVIALRMATSKSTSMWCGIRHRPPCRSCWIACLPFAGSHKPRVVQYKISYTLQLVSTH